LKILKYGDGTGWRKSVKNEVLRRMKEKRNILPAVNRKKVNWIGQFLRRNCLLKHFFWGGRGKIEEIEVTEGRGRRHKQLLDHVKEVRKFEIP